MHEKREAFVKGFLAALDLTGVDVGEDYKQTAVELAEEVYPDDEEEM